MTEAARLRAEAALWEAAADAFARDAGRLAGRAAFRRLCGPAAEAARMEHCLRLIERREASTLERARRLRLQAARLERGAETVPGLIEAARPSPHSLSGTTSPVNSETISQRASTVLA